MARYNREPAFAERERHHEGHGHMGFDSPSPPNHSMTSLAPVFAQNYGNSTRGALIPTSSNVIEEPVIEHEHHHLHHHIDHGNVNAQILQRRTMQREYSYDDLYDRDRRYGSGASLGSLHHHNSHHKERSSRRLPSALNTTSRYARSDIDLNIDSAYRNRRGLYDERDGAEYTVVDVPSGTRRVTVETSRESELYNNMRRDNGVRRSRGLGNELWTEITKDLITREAIEEMGYPYEETEYFYYIFEYLHRDQIAEMIDLTADIRHHRVRDIEYESIAGSRPRSMLTAGLERGGFDREIETDTRTEIIIEGGHSHGRRRRNRYYH